MKRTWISRVGIVALVGGLSLTHYGSGIPSANAVTPSDQSPFAGVTPNWDKNLPIASRFTVLTAFGGTAVRDNNTGLVWEQTPDMTSIDVWFSSLAHCLNRAGDTGGWRLPSASELSSLTGLVNPAAGKPFVPASVFTFSVLPSVGFWTATTDATQSTRAWAVDVKGNGVTDLDKGIGLNSWCVRGPMNADQY